MEARIAGCVLDTVRGPIEVVTERVGAIVNAANSGLRGGAGVDGAIHRVAGPELKKETDRRYPEGCPTGSAVASGAYGLNADYVFHAVGPVWSGGDSGEPDLLASAYRRCLELGLEHDVRTLRFPAISTGVYGYPIERAAHVSLKTVIETLHETDHFEHVRFVLFTDSIREIFDHALSELIDVNPD